MPESTQDPSPAAAPQPAGAGATRNWVSRWREIPLYLRILGGMLLGLLAGTGLRLLDLALRQADLLPDARFLQPLAWAEGLSVPSQLVLRLLGALASPLILLAVVQALQAFPRPAS